MLGPLEQQDPKALGERLRAARTKAGIKQEEAADALKMARTTIVAIEKGQRRIRPEELRRMAALYHTSVNALLRPSSVTVDLVPRFRALPGGSAQGADDAAALLNDLAAAEVEIEALVGAALPRNYPPERRLGTGDMREQAEDAALEMRQRLGLGLGAINDLLSVLESDVGIRVFVRALPSNISGLFAYEDTTGACILINQKHPRERRAMTAAHEFGHLIATRREPDILHTGDPAQTREERFATMFAAALLMPAGSIRRRFDDLQRDAGRFSPRHLIVMAHQFNVSEEALCRRLQELGLLPDGTWDSLRERGFSGQHVREVFGDAPQEPTVILPPRLWLLAAQAYRQELLSEGQLARLLRLDRVQVRSIIDTLADQEFTR
jgi:Zn-dependent peptidase ImmA (M78 family)/DNA-binding XRE family transcriptional regulator